MKNFFLVTAIVLVVAFAAGGWWLAQRWHSAGHSLVRQVSTRGEVYYTCPMHPQVRQPEPGNCPICGMKLLRKQEQSSQPAPETREQRMVLYWYDPMRPDQHFDAPGKSPYMDMDLAPKYADDTEGGVVDIDPRMVQNLGIRTAPVQRGAMEQRVDAVGIVEIDERTIVAVETRVAGWVERLVVRATGEPVRRGQVIAGIYAPELYAAQEELLLAAKAGDAALAQASQRRLDLLGVSAGQQKAVTDAGQPRRQVDVYAPTDGIVTELNVREGSQVAPGMPILRIADLSRVWVNVEIPEAQGTWVSGGEEAEVRVAGLSGSRFAGRVDYVYPQLESETRTVRARIALDNASRALKPGMYVNVTLMGAPRADIVLVPTESVIRTGERSVVILSEKGGRFRPAAVRIGAEQDGLAEVISGLRAGETVVVSGQFLIDSEANLRGAIARMHGEPPAGRMRQLGAEGAPPVYGGRAHPPPGDNR